MKTFLLLLVLSSAFITRGAVRPEPVPSKLTEIKSNAWYIEMFDSWHEYLSENPQDKSGWIEYFKAGQYGGLPDSELNRISEEIHSKFNNSVESHYVRYKLGGWTSEGILALRSGVEMSDENELLPEKLLLAEYDLDDAKRVTYAGRLHSSNLLYPSLLNYSYNVLMSVDQNGVLFTKGENTTVPLYILQDAMNVRKDVLIINLDLAQNEDYLTRKLLDVHLDPGSDLTVDLGQKLPESNPGRKFYYALTMPRQNLEKVEDRLYVVGLTSQLSEKEIDNYTILKTNIEQNFLLDYLTVDFNGEPKTATGRKLESNYVVPFLLMKKYYDKTGNPEMSKLWGEKLMTIADRNGIRDRVESLLGDAPQLTFKPMELDMKELDGNLMQVRGNLYASRYEVTNEEYRVFLQYLEDNGYEDQFKEAVFDFSGLDDLSIAMRKGYHVYPIKVKIETDNLQKSRMWEKSHFKNYPAFDMTYEAALLYCKWLSDVYNAQVGRKYKKVQFRLPSQKEWTMAALGYKDFQSWEFEMNQVAASVEGGKETQNYQLKKEECLYPWAIRAWNYRATVYNRFQCILANVKIPDVVTCPAGALGDGFRVTSPVGSYFPNEMGLFDTVGNVAEMINEKGKAMGGSWNHAPEESTIHSISDYDERSTSVGFRLFMEVIEE